jgi:hypothetical protein
MAGRNGSYDGPPGVAWVAVSGRFRLRLIVAVLSVILVAAAAVAADSGEAPETSRAGGSCPLADAPTNANEWRRFDGRRVKEMLVLGCGRLSDGRRFELVARRFPRTKFFCLDAYLPKRRAALECGALPQPRRGVVDVSAFAPPGTLLTRRLNGSIATGAASARVARVELVLGDAASRRRQQAALVTVRSPELLRTLGLDRPFGFHASAPPPTAERANIEAFDARGKLLGRAPLPALR